MSANFVHLRFHSEYSVQDGIVRLDPILEEVMEQGGVALGITDSMNLFGALRFYSHAMADGIKPIVGCDLWITNTAQGKRDNPYRLTLYCQNHDGYLSLCELLSRGWMENQYLGRGEVRLEWLTPDNCKGLICLSGGPQGVIERHLLDDNKTEANAVVEQLRTAFPDRFYLEVQRAGRKNDEAVVANIAQLAVETGLPMVATHPVQFLHREDFNAHEVRCCIAGGYVLADPRRPKPYTEEQYLKTEEEMRALFADIPQAIDNTVVIAQRCNLDGVFQKPQLPLFPTPEGVSLDEYMAQLSHEGLERRLEFLYPNQAERDARRPEYVERLEYELKTISSMKFPGYFLIVQDFINWSKRNGVAVGPGRGSGAGSLVAYALGITDLDPLHYGLLFERFLNPERVSMPDFDVDFCQHNRDRTIEYVKRTYGVDAVSQIVTFGAMGAKAVVRDVGRVLNMGYGKVDDLAKLIPQKPGMDVTLAKAAEMEPEFKAMAERDDYVELMSYAQKLEGLTRNLGMHAGGVLIAPSKLTDFCPLYNADGSPENTVSQFDKKDIENVGLVKFDFLGLTTLTILTKAAEYIDRLNPGTKFDLSRIPTDDKKTLELFQQGNTGAVFQFESDGMREQLRQAKPDCLEDLVALNALYRPGPMDQIPHFIDRKFGREKVEYLDPRMEPILRETYGIMVYQEQVMQIVRDLAGYTLGRSDLLRRAMSKKKADVMQKERQIFVYGDEENGVPGCIKNGIDEKTANKIYDEMIDFAKYAFNKSHAAAYAVVAYQTAFLKYYYPVEFMAALMTSVIENPPKVAEYIYACRQMNIQILSPDINRGIGNFSVDGNNIRYGLAAIKSIGRPVIAAIIEDRDEFGPFKNLEDFISRMSVKDGLNKRAIEHLIKSGALDCLGGTRKQFMSIYVQIVDHVNQEKKYAMTGQMTLFDMVGEEEKEQFEIKLPDVGEYSKENLLAFEKEVLGVYLSGHPLQEYEDKWRKSISATTLDFQPDEETGRAKVHDGTREIVGGMITAKTIKHTKTNQMMAFLSLEDLVGTVEVIVFPRDYEKNREYLEIDKKIFVKGRVSEEEERPSKLICETIIPFEQTKKELWVQFSDKEDFLRNEHILYGYLADSEGDDEVVIYCQKERAIKRLPRNRNIRIGQEVLSRLMNHYGEKRVKVVEKSIDKGI